MGGWIRKMGDEMLRDGILEEESLQNGGLEGMYTGRVLFVF